LHIKHTFKVVFGENKAPTIKIFQGLKEDFDNVDKDEEPLKVLHWPVLYWTGLHWTVLDCTALVLLVLPELLYTPEVFRV
jgi:hypothetical protein